MRRVREEQKGRRGGERILTYLIGETIVDVNHENLMKGCHHIANDLISEGQCSTNDGDLVVIHGVAEIIRSTHSFFVLDTHHGNNFTATVHGNSFVVTDYSIQQQ